MKQYLVTDTFVNFGIGAILELSEKQYESRKHLLKKLSGSKYEATQTVQFKRGEVVGIEGELDKYLLTKVNPCEVKKDKKNDVKI